MCWRRDRKVRLSRRQLRRQNGRSGNACPSSRVASHALLRTSSRRPLARRPTLATHRAAR
eukprot:6725271-Lingulodinium_polyedra.AAC.1